MADAISTFFEAWSIESSDERLKLINSAVTDAIEYDDPRTPQTVKGINALNDYVGMFAANAPGWSARVLGSDTIAQITRATVAFGGKGPDGNEVTQIGQYYVETEGGKVSRMVGFVGTGSLE
ncbi:MAG: hypothetical protein ABJN62_19790 [Halioglobus sp.]